MTPAPTTRSPKDSLAQIGQEVRDSYTRNKRVMSFDEFFAALPRAPRAVRAQRRAVPEGRLRPLRHRRGEDAARHASRAGSSSTCPFDGGRDRLVGQEEVQARVYRVSRNFVREGGVNKLILLHGPERLGQVDLRRAAWCARSSTTRRSTRARSIASTGSSRRRSCRRAASASAALPATTAGGTARDTFAYLDDEHDRRQARRRAARQPAACSSRRSGGSELLDEQARRGKRVRRRPTTSATAISATRTSRSSRRCWSPTRATT